MTYGLKGELGDYLPTGQAWTSLSVLRSNWLVNLGRLKHGEDLKLLSSSQNLHSDTLCIPQGPYNGTPHHVCI
jgi:hypothetical protein